MTKDDDNEVDNHNDYTNERWNKGNHEESILVICLMQPEVVHNKVDTLQIRINKDLVTVHSRDIVLSIKPWQKQFDEFVET